MTIETVNSTPSRPLPLQPTPRTTGTRLTDRTVKDRPRFMEFMRDALVAHVGVDMGSHPVVLPSAYAVDPDGPDDGGTLYLHGSVGAGWIRAGRSTTLCVTVTELDGLVAARSPFHHSMNYRSAVVIGAARVVDDPVERQHALDLIIDHMIPGRSATLRPSTRKELAATEVLALPLLEASMKERQGGPGDDHEDVAAGGWAGHVPLRRIAGHPVTADDADGEVPREVAARAEALRAG